jgi:hypothetical protein
MYAKGQIQTNGGHHQGGLLLGVKQTQSARKRTWRFECRLLGVKGTWLVRVCQDRS